MKEGTLTAIIALIVIGILLVGGIWFLAHNKKEESLYANFMLKQHQNIREPAVAGAFYPADPAELAREVDNFLAEAEKIPPSPPFNKGGLGRILGLIVP